MKKALSIILALVLALTMALPAFAANHEIGLNEPQIIGNKNGDTETVVFTPEEDGFYKFSFEIKSGSYEDIRWDFDFSCVNISEYPTEEAPTKLDLVFIGEKDTPVTVEFYNDMGESYKVSVEFSEFSCDTLTEGSKTVDIPLTGTCFKFVPENDGYYNFKSSNGNDPVIEIIGTEGFDAYNDDNGFDGDLNFDLTASLEAGKTYIVFIYDYEKASKCDLTVTYGATEKVEELYIDLWGGTKLPKNYTTWLDFAVAPTGAAPTADVKVTSSDESIISIDDIDFEYGEATITTHNSGKAVITVTAGGVTEEMKVKVYSDFEWFFVRLFDSIHWFFYRLFHGLLF